MVAAIDIGSTKISALIGAAQEGTVTVLGAGVVPARGVEKAMVADLGEAAECVAEAVRLAEEGSGYRIERAYVSVGGCHIQSRNSRGETAVTHALRGVEEEDAARALAEASKLSLPAERQIVHVVPRGFWLDGNVLVRDPLGMAAYRMEAEVHIVTALSSAVRNLTRCVNEADVEVAGLILQSLASGESVLTESERDMGVALLDIGGGTTDLAVYLSGGIWHTSVIPSGGNHVTSDLAIGLHCPTEVAEDIKLRFGQCRSGDATMAHDRIRVAGFVGNGAEEVSREEVMRIVEARVEEIFTLVLRELRRSSYDGLLSAGVVLCGGTANLPGIAPFASEVLDMPVRVVPPRRVEGLTQVIGDLSQATGVGLLLWGAREAGMTHESSEAGFWSRVGRVFRSVLPG